MGGVPVTAAPRLQNGVVVPRPVRPGPQPTGAFSTFGGARSVVPAAPPRPTRPSPTSAAGTSRSAGSCGTATGGASRFVPCEAPGVRGVASSRGSGDPARKAEALPQAGAAAYPRSVMPGGVQPPEALQRSTSSAASGGVPQASGWEAQERAAWNQEAQQQELQAAQAKEVREQQAAETQAWELQQQQQQQQRDAMQQQQLMHQQQQRDAMQQAEQLAKEREARRLASQRETEAQAQEQEAAREQAARARREVRELEEARAREEAGREQVAKEQRAARERAASRMQQEQHAATAAAAATAVAQAAVTNQEDIQEESERFASREAEALRREREEAEQRRREAEAPAEAQREPDGVVSALQALWRLHHKSDPAGLCACLQTLRSYIGNLAKNPSDQKFQRINCENGHFLAKVANIQGATAVLEACGFVPDGSSLVVCSDFLKSKGPKLWDALSKVDVILDQVKRIS
ncbi:unnamed protein product [Polarella glacialis]|uniref:PUB domain-containing protein n=1 Tax=Polarella glacialis TaxID=89957 RepID=A0A813FUG9_POLGL|nr:unnamed protein product [Polarella glacialis]